MFAGLFPKSTNRDYAGSLLAPWFLAPVALMKTVIGFNISGLNPWISNRHILETVDGYPLGELSPEALKLVLDFAESWGLASFSLGLFVLVVLLRYRAMLPLACFALLIDQGGRKLLGYLDAPEQEFDLSAGALINWGFLAALIVGLALSLRRRT
jgi:hypothetical protein